MDKLRETVAPDGTAEIRENEIAASNGTWPPLNFISILRDAGITIDMSSPNTLSDQLYAGVFLKPSKLKYFVDKKLDKNGFVFFARELFILHSTASEDYWAWTTERDASGVDIEVAELLKVWALEIRGSIWTVNLSLETLYEIVFVVMIKGGTGTDTDSSISNFSPELGIIPPHSKPITHSVSLRGKPSDQWIEIQVGEFRMSPQTVGDMDFYLMESKPIRKSGLLVKCAVIRPKNL